MVLAKIAQLGLKALTKGTKIAAQGAKSGTVEIGGLLSRSAKRVKGGVQTSVSRLRGENIIYPNSRATRKGVMVGRQTGNKVMDAYKVDIEGPVEEVLKKNPGLKYDAEQGKYFVQTSWGEKSYIQNSNYMYVKYGESVGKDGVKVIDHNAVEGLEFSDTYIDHAKFEADGTLKYINTKKLKPGQHVVTSKNAPARFKIVEPGTKYMSAEGVHTVQPGSVLRIDGQGRPYQSTVEFMLKKVELTPEQMEKLYKVDPVGFAKTDKGAEYIMKHFGKIAGKEGSWEYSRLKLNDKTIVLDRTECNIRDKGDPMIGVYDNAGNILHEEILPYNKRAIVNGRERQVYNYDPLTSLIQKVANGTI